MGNHIYSISIRGLRALIRKTAMRGWTVEGDGQWESAGPAEAGPAVYVVHHQNLLGPVCAAALMPEEARLWVLHVFCSRRACFEQYYGYTFTQRFGWVRPAAFAAAGLLSLCIPRFLHGLGAIPVYRGTREIRRTVDRSLSALLSGESLIICPDRDYASGSPETGEIYNGFLHLEKVYFRKTGMHLRFVPLCCRREDRRLVRGPAVRFSGAGSFAEEQREIAARLVETMNRLAEGKKERREPR